MGPTADTKHRTQGSKSSQEQAMAKAMMGQMRRAHWDMRKGRLPERKKNIHLLADILEFIKERWIFKA